MPPLGGWGTRAGAPRRQVLSAESEAEVGVSAGSPPGTKSTKGGESSGVEFAQ